MFRTVLFVSALALFAVNAARFEDVPEEVRKLTGEDLVQYINKQGGTWTAESNKFDGLSKDELKKFLGAMKKPAHMHRRGTPGKSVKLDKVPDSFDAIQAWPQCAKVIGLIQDQSACGSCWAVSTTSVMSDRLCIQSNASIQTSISALDLMACCNYCGYQCQGGWPDEAFYKWTKEGIVTGDSYTADSLCLPYPIAPCHLDDKTGKNVCPKEPRDSYKCTKKCQASYKAESYKNDHYFGKNVQYFSNQNDDAIAELIAAGPIVAAFNVYEDFYKYKSGVYQYKGGDFVGGHAVRIVGYGTTKDGVDFWKVANSWNDYWGENGYFRILRGTNDCGFEEEITSALADVKRSLQDK
jgi:cathepsin B